MAELKGPIGQHWILKRPKGPTKYNVSYFESSGEGPGAEVVKP